MKYFPIFIDAQYINALVIGGGDVAARKIELLLKTTQQITVMAETLNNSVQHLVISHQLPWLAHNYQANQLSQYTLVIAATNNPSVNQAIAQEAHQLHIFVNVVDQPALCSYITPAIIDRDPMLVAISSSGSSPVLVRILREHIDRYLPQNYGRLADFCFRFREQVKTSIKQLRDRRLFWERVLTGNIGSTLLQGDDTSAAQQLTSALTKKMTPTPGELIFIYTANGDPDNLTLNAYRDMQVADAVFFETNINQQLLEYVRRDADKHPQINSSHTEHVQSASKLAMQGFKVLYLLNGHPATPQTHQATPTQLLVTTHISGA